MSTQLSDAARASCALAFAGNVHAITRSETSARTGPKRW
jgi:hypothetical protein